MGTFEGPAAISGFWEDWWSSYEHLQIDVLEIREIGNGVVLAAFHFQGAPKGPPPRPRPTSRLSMSGHTTPLRM
jgi:hypothetical protein